jgi:hypothetical protein
MGNSEGSFKSGAPVTAAIAHIVETMKSCPSFFLTRTRVPGLLAISYVETYRFLSPRMRLKERP